MVLFALRVVSSRRMRMATVVGDLIQVMKACVNGGSRLAILVIDEQADAIPDPYRIAQERVIRCARLLGMPIIFIELNPKLGVKPTRPTTSDLRHAAAGAQCEVITKATFNSFVGTRLADVLDVYDVTVLVVLGRMTNQCVKNTSIGGKENDTGDQIHDGAVQKGFRVLSTDLIIRPSRPQWQQAYPADQLAFYTNVLDMDARTLLVAKDKPLPQVPSKPLPKPPGQTGTSTET
jgi:nicotinamidase-related amidase